MSEENVEKKELNEEALKKAAEEAKELLAKGEHQKAVDHMKSKGFEAAAKNLEESLKAQGILR